ncbi:DDB1- and CUL4-associated factor 4 [Podarcis raffonei]|uniref:DDB1- and CUL4-associated factor 4 n=1 Tax=Podarcis raffonei TaxID=65483 RepID=UPI00232987F0|nr:DDB1- and CUL4-associated factor 4 [Podarcis raffonei]XP_053240343.1 DDB1- and CUL4-associated factor 4 [Podarcis raffonei]
MKRNCWRGRICWRDNRRPGPNQTWRIRHRWTSSARLGREPPLYPDTGEDESPSAALSEILSSMPPPELPGFYYDPERNRYFRLLPGHNNSNPLTNESIQHRRMESQRLKLLEEEEKCMKKASRSGLNSSIVLRKRQLGLPSSINYRRSIHELKVNCMQRRKLEIETPDSSICGSNNFKLIMADSASERIFTVNDVEHGGCKCGIVNLSGLGKNTLTVEMYDNLYFTNRKVNSVCWASLSHPDSHVLLCLMGIAETLGCASLLPASLFNNSNAGDQPGMLCSFKISTAWSCAWCLNPQADNYFSTGLSKQVHVTNAVTGHRQIFSISSDALAQQFATQAPVLYNGCRSGEIFSIDIRRPMNTGQGLKSLRLFHDSAVTSVNLLKDEQYLLAADMAGRIKLWDLRKLKCVKEYHGHHNEHSILPLHVNEEEGLLTAVGQDCYTRIWSLQDAHLLRTIPSPHPFSTDSIPSVEFSSHLGGSRGVPGLLMAVKQDLHYFSYKTDDPYCLSANEADNSTPPQ